MADTIPITAGSGTIVSTDEITTLNGGAIAAQHVQRIGNAIITSDGVAIDLPGDSASGLWVNVKDMPALATGANIIGGLAAGTNNIGDVDVLTLPALPAGNNNIGDVDVASLPALPAGSNNIGDVDVLTVPADPFGVNADAASATGSISAKLRFIAATGIPITGTVTVGSHAVTNAGVFVVQIDGSALTALQLLDDTIFADEAAFTVASSKVGTIGLHTVVLGAAPDASAADTVVNPITNRNRVPFQIGGDPGTITLKHTTITTAVTDAAIITVSAGNKIVVTRLTVTLDNASTVFPTVLIGFGTANTPTTTGVLAAHGGVPAGGGFTIGDGSGIIGIGADNEDLRITTTGNATGNGLQVTCSYHLVPS